MKKAIRIRESTHFSVIYHRFVLPFDLFLSFVWLKIFKIKALEDERDKLIQDNKHLAEHNLSFESTYRVSKQQLAKAVEECHAVKTEMDKKHMKLREFSQQNSLDATLAVMQAAMAEMEEASEDIANAWLRKETSIDQFLKVIVLVLFDTWYL